MFNIMVNIDAFDKFINIFIPNHINPGSDDHRRRRMFLISHFCGPFLGLPIVLFLFNIDPSPSPHVPILGLSISMFCLFPFVVRLMPQYYEVLALLSVQNLIFAILWGAHHYGGASSPFLIWFAVVPLLAFFYLGSSNKTRMIVFGQILCGLGLFHVAHLLYPNLEQHIPLNDLETAGIVSTLSAAIYVFIMASYYARIVDSQSELLREIARHETTLSKLTEAKNEAERANGAKSEFLAKMSHELRTPLNAVLGYSEILLEEAELEGNGQQIADIEKISAAGKHLLSMVNDILDMSKIEAGKMDLFPIDVDLDKFFNEVDLTSRPLATKNTNAFEVDRGTGSLGMIRTDATKLRQVVLNLISNAAKFTHNGVITMQVRRVKTSAGDDLEIVVCDTGMGISIEQQKMLFSKFTQANPMIASKYGGTGLGLSLSRNLCQLMGGDISVVSTLGKGSKFTISIPDAAEHRIHSETVSNTDLVVAELDLQESRPARIVKSSPAPQKRVLIIDDDAAFLELANRVLSKENLNVLCTSASSSALQLARTFKPDVVLLDILMPDVDGWQVLHSLKLDAATSKIPIVVLSVTDAKKRAMDAGAFAVLARPAHRVALVEAIRSACYRDEDIAVSRQGKKRLAS